ncbi:TraR/DksA C4-type zinc finger protein [Chitinivorax sp. PXF-14]|uniref:TraR/DksA C4-type zinc finger protein n=1 Tax=Chitinivorax sp. PXF-14 TaxID=3230488 RepID=UPI0034674AE3
MKRWVLIVPFDPCDGSARIEIEEDGVFSNNEVDLAVEREQQALDANIQTVRAQLPAGTSAEFCTASDCGAEIPQQRRDAVPGCRYCIDCQARLERVGGMNARRHA